MCATTSFGDGREARCPSKTCIQHSKGDAPLAFYLHESSVRSSLSYPPCAVLGLLRDHLRSPTTFRYQNSPWMYCPEITLKCRSHLPELEVNIRAKSPCPVSEILLVLVEKEDKETEIEKKKKIKEEMDQNWTTKHQLFSGFLGSGVCSSDICCSFLPHFRIQFNMKFHSSEGIILFGWLVIKRKTYNIYA